MARPSTNYGERKSQNRYGDRGNGTKQKDYRSSKPINDSQKLAIPPRPDWHTADLPPLNAPITKKASLIPPALIEKLQAHAQTLLEDEASIYAAQQLKTSSSYKFMSTIMGTGTWSDKVSALTLVVQESPLHTAKPLENLIGLAGKKSRDQALIALNALKDLMDQGNVLPDRKLRFFAKQPSLLAALQGVDTSFVPPHSLPNGLTKQHLMFWVYEDKLKRLYLDMLKIVEKWCHDEIEFARLRALDFVWELLKNKPEQEENLLRFLVNKLGDNAKKVASKASYRLCGLQELHPAMTMDIVKAVEADILLRPGQSSHAKYYATITLNQFVLRTSDPEVAEKLLDVYFTLFKAILNRTEKLQETTTEKKIVAGAEGRKRTKTVTKHTIGKSEAELDEKVTAQVLTGIHRAFPYSNKDSIAFEKHFDTMFRITHSSNFNTSLQALILIQQISASLQVSTDRYMRTLYQSLFDPRLFSSSKQPMYINLLYRSLKDDPSIRRVKAFVKRLLQTLSTHEPPFICLALYLIIELSNIFPSLKSMLSQSEIHEHTDRSPSPEVTHTATDAPRPSINDEVTKATRSQAYDGRKREPEYSNADRTCLWDILPYLTHHHPSVSLFASHILSNSPIKPNTTPLPPPPKPDPTTHTLTHFLDKFAYKNPKSATAKDGSATLSLRGSSLMQPALASSNATDTLLPTSRRTESERLNNEAFWQRRAEDVRPDEVFFHKYFGMTREGKAGRSRKEKQAERQKQRRGEESDEEVDDGGADIGVGEGEMDEDEVWRAIVGSKPDVEMGDGDEEDEFGGDDVSIEEEMDDSDIEDEDEDEVEDEDMGDVEDSEDEGSVVAGEEVDEDEADGVAADGMFDDNPNSAGEGVALPNLHPAATNDTSTTAKPTKQRKPKSTPKPTDTADASDSDADPFALGSDEGSSSEDSDVAAGKTNTSTNIRARKPHSQRRTLDDEEVKAFIAAETRLLGRKSKRGNDTVGKSEGRDKGKKRKLKQLPVFGSVEDWRGLVEGDGDREGEEKE